MTNTELKQVFTKRLPSIMPHILYNSEGKEDLKQEGLLGMWLSLKNDPNCKDRFIKNNVVWKMIECARKGKSVDSNVDSFKRREKHIELIKLDAIAEEVSEYILEDKSVPIDDKVIDKISWERYLTSLNNLEKRFVMARLKELSREQIYKTLELGQYAYLRMRRSALRKFKESFAC